MVANESNVIDGMEAEVARLSTRALLQMEIAEHKATLDGLYDQIAASFEQSLNLIETSLRNGGKLLLFGNGGSAADAQHIAAELVIRYKDNRPAIAAIALTTDTSTLTACGNDFGFEHLFARQVEALGRAGDVALGISTSGNSANVIEALRTARQQQLHTVGLVGGAGGKMAPLCDALIGVRSKTTARVQEMHILVGHMLCKALERRLGFA